MSTISDNELSVQSTTEVVADKEVQVLHCRGDVDTKTFDSFQAAMLQPLEQQHCHIIVDMSGVTYIHSTGYGLLLTVQRQAQAAGGKLVVAGFSSKVGSIFQLLGFDRVIPSFPTVEEALQSFR